MFWGVLCEMLHKCNGIALRTPAIYHRIYLKLLSIFQNVLGTYLAILLPTGGIPTIIFERWSQKMVLEFTFLPSSGAIFFGRRWRHVFGDSFPPIHCQLPRILKRRFIWE
jgi:hypothetical protein